MALSTITNGATLLTAVVEYLARDQDSTLTARIPSFIQFAEAKFNRLLFVRQMEQRSTSTLDITQSEPEFLELPSDFQSMRRIRLSSVSGKPRLKFLSGSAMDEYRESVGNVTGQPVYFTVLSDEIELAPTPDADYTVEMVYRQNLTSVLTGDGTNWLITLAPDIYLYGTLLESAPYIKEDGRIQTWLLGFKTALDDLNALGNMSTFNSGPLTMRLSGATP